MSILLAQLVLVFNTTEGIGTPSDTFIQDGRGARDVYCGARAVQFVFTFFDRSYDDDLYKLAHTLDFDNLEGSVPISSLKNALERNGIFAEAVRVPPTLLPQLRWKFPIILHLRYDDLGAAIGHYIVWLPTSNSHELHIWDGLNGEQVADFDTMMVKMSGNLLLTSSEPIDRGLVTRTLAQDDFRTGLFVLLFITLLTILFAGVLNLRRKCLSSERSLD